MTKSDPTAATDTNETPVNAATETRPTRNIAGIMAMLAAMVFITTNEAFVKAVTAELPTGQLIALRATIGLILILPVAYWFGALKPVPAMWSWPFAVQVLAEVAVAACYIAALAHLPLASLGAIVQITPLISMAASALVLGERVGWRRWMAAGIGFAGVMLIVKPGTDSFHWAAIGGLATAAFLAMRDIATRALPAAVPTLLVIVASSVALIIYGVSRAPFETWIWPSDGALVRLFFSAVFILCFYALIIRAFRLGEVSVVAPFRYTKVLWALLLGYLMFQEWPDAWSLFGMMIVLGSGVYIFFRETRLAARGKTS